MKKIVALLVLTVVAYGNSLFSQNVGIGTTSPTSTLHILPALPSQNPLRVEGLQIYTNETSVFAVDPNTGVVKHMPINTILANVDSLYLDSTILSTVINNFDTIFGLMRDSLLLDTTFMNTLRDSVDSDIDSIRFVNDTLYLYEDNQILTAYINASTNTNLIDSLILANSDTLYTITRDSLLNDSLFLDSLISMIGDSIDTDIDSVVLIGDTLHIYEDGVNIKADISGILDSLKTRDSLFTPDYVIFADSNGRLSEDTTLHFKTAVNAKGDRALLLNTDTIINVGNSSWSQLQVYKKETNYESVVSLEDGYLGLSMAGDADPVIHFEHRGGSFSNSSPLDTSANNNTSMGTIVFLGQDSTTTRGTQATFQGTSKSYNNQRLLTGFLFTGRTTTTPADPKLTYGYNFPSFHNNSELLLELNNDGNGSMQAHFYKDSRNDTTPINNFLYTDANGVFQSKSIDTLIQVMRDSLDDANWKLNANTTGLEAAAAGDNLASGNYAIAAGQSDTATGQYSTISGGRQNKATGSYSTITGGYQNYTNGSYSSVSGYRDSIVSSSYSNISGGYLNKISSSSYAHVSGRNNEVIGSSYSNLHGNNNYMEGSFNATTIFGNRDTAIRTVEGSFIGGQDNSIIASPGAVTGRNTIFGVSNKMRVLSGNDSWGWSILGGYNNTITGTAASGNAQNIIGSYDCRIEAPPAGQWNAMASIIASLESKFLTHPSAGSSRSTIIGGQADTIQGSGGTLLSGNSNKAYGGGWHVLLGGSQNKINNQWFSAVIAGSNNRVNNSHSSGIYTGRSNTLDNNSDRSAIIAGDTNLINNSADHAVILGGTRNTANNFAQVALGHYSTNNVPVGASASAIDPDNILFKIGNGTDASNLSDAMVVKADGNAGIGTSTPLNTLHLSKETGDTRLRIVADPSNTNESWNPGITLHQDGGAISSFIGLTGDADFGLTGTVYPLMFGNNLLFSIDNPSNPNSLFTNIYFSIDDTVKMTIKANGNVGIGTINPSEKLTVFNGTTTGTYTTTGWVHSSDSRLKTNITPISEALNIINNMEGVYYNWKKDSKGNRQIGFIAQDVQKILPEVVVGKEGDVEKGETLSMAYQNIVPVLVEAIKEQQETINTSKKEIKSLKSENDLLKDRLEKIENSLNKLLNK